MLTIPLGKFRESDLVNTWEALRAHGERILGHTQLPADCIVATPFGLVIDQTGASRKWQPSDPGKGCHLFNLVELPDYGIHALINHQVGTLPAGNFIALSTGYHLSAAAEYLRTELIGPNLSVYTAPRIHTEIATGALGIPSRPSNDLRLPSASELRYAPGLLRLDRGSALDATNHFNLPPLPVAEPVIVQLGARTILAIARSESEETLRGIICETFYESTARRDLLRWLKGLKTSTKIKTSTP
jgi:hypothetical protein